jgi:small subunit ribosomal protein S20
MPITRSAIKSLNQERKRRLHNQPIRDRIRMAMRKAKENGNSANVSSAYSLIDRAAKVNVIHTNKANRLKSRLQAFLKEKSKSSK